MSLRSTISKMIIMTHERPAVIFLGYCLRPNLVDLRLDLEDVSHIHVVSQAHRRRFLGFSHSPLLLLLPSTLPKLCLLPPLAPSG